MAAFALGADAAVVRLAPEANKDDVNSNNLTDMRPYRFFDATGEFTPPSSVSKSQPQCEFCFNVMPSYSALFKHTARPCHEDENGAVSQQNDLVRVVFPASRLFFIEDALRALQLDYSASSDRVAGWDDEPAYEFSVERSLLELTNRRLYIASCTKYNLDRYYEALFRHGLTPRTGFLPLDADQRRFLQALISTTMAQSLGMGQHLRNAELLQREQLEDAIDAFIRAQYPNAAPPPRLFLKFTTRSPKDAVAVRDDAALSVEERLRLKTEALLVNCGVQAVDLLARSQRIYADCNLFDKYGVPGTSSGQLGLVFRERIVDIRPELEFRCFVAPGKRLTAISQYNCYDAFAVLQDDRFCRRVAAAIVRMHDAVSHDIPLPAYVADVAVVGPLDADPLRLTVIELNPFGADLSSGSCLFHWRRDFDLLHGRCPPDRPVEMRVLKN